jgi:hypothetical protein
VEPILQIHRGPDGYVQFARKLDDDEWQRLPSISVSRLQQMFPQFAQQLMRDSYFSINTRFQPNHKRLTRLNACWVDIDLHGPGTIATVGDVIGKEIDMVRAGQLPKPSLTVYSGRGVWYLWLLVDKDGQPPKAFPENELALEAINRELQRRMSSDAGACDPGRHLRIPGSTNSKADPGHEVVRFLFDVDARGRYAEYTLDDLVERLAIESAKRKESRPKEVTGYGAVWLYRWQDFEQLRRIRGGFQDGCRNNAAFLCAVILQHNGLQDTAIENHLIRFAAECTPPLPPSQVKAIMQEISKTPIRKYREEKIIGMLKITPDEGKLIPRWDQTRIITVEADKMDAGLRRGNPRIEYRKQVLVP